MSNHKKNKIVTVWESNSLVKNNIDFLRKPTKNVTFPLSSQDKEIINDLRKSFDNIPCAGIAANQLGYNKKIFIGMKFDRDFEEKSNSSKNLDDVVPNSKENCELYINPQIDKINKDSTQRGDEGCLSIPGLTLSIERFDKIKVRYYDINGRVIKKPLKGFISRLFQHELDHLNGNLMFENPLSSISIKEAQNQKFTDMLMEVINYIQNK